MKRREGMEYEDGIGPMLKLQEMEADGYEGFSYLKPYELGLLLRDCLAALSADGPVVIHDGKVERVRRMTWTEYGDSVEPYAYVPEGGDDE